MSTPTIPTPTIPIPALSIPAKPLVPILTHTHADFDALASLLAASLLYAEATPVLPRQLGRSVEDFLTLYRNLFPFITAEEWASRLGRGKVARVIVVDTQKFDYVKGMTDQTPRQIIDHHRLDEKLQPPPTGWTVWHEPLGANVTLLIEKLMAQPLTLSSAQATLMALGIHSDTGSLTYSNSTDRDARALAWLMRPAHEINLDVLARFLHYPLSEAERALLQTLIDSATWKTVAEAKMGEVAETKKRPALLFVHASIEAFEDSLAALATRLQETFDPDALFLLVQIDDMIQIVARSRVDEIDVGRVADALGGGGHPRAAAATIDADDERAPLSEVLAALPDKIRTLLNQHYRPGLTVADIMTYGRPQTLPPDLPIGEAVERMTRYGYEGFPVVERAGESERLVGVFTRRQGDRAVSHGLHKEPVRRFMQAGRVFVHPGDSVQTLHRTMIDSDWGQVPVLAAPEAKPDEHDKLIGIVTRTDLIKTWGQELSHGPGSISAQRGDFRSVASRDLSNPNVPNPNISSPQISGAASSYASLLHETLPPAQHALLQQIGRAAAAQGLTAYVVGGFVRDLLLHAQKEASTGKRVGKGADKLNAEASIDNVDIDIVIEGDALPFAQRLQARYGGRLVMHARFGTAKWILGSDEEPVDWSLLLNASGDEQDVGADAAARPLDLPPHLDFISARMEFYAEPSALPTVERSSIKLDLHRRDFTVNTLALSLHPARWARLYDFYGGLADLQRGVVRVLHSLSFVDDPTRILRGVRYEQRFGFHIEARTLDLLHDALDLLDRVTPARLNHEIERILQEAQPELDLNRLDELGVLAAIHPSLKLDERVAGWFGDLRLDIGDWDDDHGSQSQISNLRSQFIAHSSERLYWSLLLWPIDPAADSALAARLDLRQETQRLVADVRRVQAAREWLTRDAAPSAVVERLRGVDEAAVGLARLVWSSEHGPDDEAVAVLGDYVERWRHVRPALDGNDLRELGIPRGPRYGEILRALLAGRLDGKISTWAEEVALAHSLAEQT